MMPDTYVTEITLDASPAEAGAQAYATALARIVQAQEGAASSSEQLVRLTDSVGRSISGLAGASASSLDKLLRGVDPMLDAYRQIEDAQRRLAANAVRASATLAIPGISDADAAKVRAQLATLTRLSDELGTVKMSLHTGTLTPEQATAQTRAVFQPHQSPQEAARLAAERQVAALQGLTDAHTDGLMNAVSQQKAANGAFVAGQYQQHYNQMLGVDAPSGPTAASSADAFAQQDADMRRLLATYDSTYAATQRLTVAEDQLAAAIKAVDVAQAAGELDDHQATRARAALGGTLDRVRGLHAGVASGAVKGSQALEEFAALAGKAEGGTKRLSIAQMELVAAASRSADALAAGASPLRVMAMEAGRLIEALAFSGISLTGLAVGAAAIVAPFAAAALAAHQVSEAYNETQRVIALTGNVLGVTATQFQAMADQAAAAGGLSRSSALAIAQGYAASGQIGAQAIQGLTTVTRAWAKATGVSVDEASKSLTQMFINPGKGAEDLARATHQVSVDEVNRIDALQRSGDLYGAQLELLGQIKTALEAVAKIKPDKGSLWDILGKDLSNAWSSFGGMFSHPDTQQYRLGTALTEQRDAHTSLDAFRATVGSSPSGVDLDTLAQLQSRAAAADQNVADARQAITRSQDAAKADQAKAHANDLGLQARQLIDAGPQWQANQVKDNLDLLKRAHDAHAIGDDDYASAKQRLDAQMAGIQTPFQKFQDQQSIEDQVRAAPPAQREALRARLAARDALQGVDASAQEKAAMEAAAYGNVLKNQQAAQRDHAAAMDADTAALGRVAAAYRLSAAAGEQAEIQRRIDAEGLSNLAIRADAAGEAQRRLAAASAQAQATMAKGLAQLRDRVDDGRAASFIGDPVARSQAEIAARAGAWAQPGVDAAMAQTDPMRQARDLAAAQAMRQRYEALLSRQGANSQRAQLTSQLYSGEGDLDMMRREVDLLGQDADARAVAIARLREEQRIRQEMPQLYASSDPQDRALVARRINQAGQIAAVQAQTQTQKDAYDEVSGFATHAADTVGSAFASMLNNGHSAAIGLRDVWKGVIGDIEQELISLSITNPLKMALTGAGGPTGATLFGGGGPLSAMGGGLASWLFGGGGFAPDWGAMTPMATNDLAASSALNQPLITTDVGDIGLLGDIPHFAGGGRVSGPGTGTSDSIPARLGNGEYVVNAAATARWLPQLEAINNNRPPPAPPPRHFASGGYVGNAPAWPGGGGAPVVNIHNYGDNAVEVKPSTAPDGTQQIDAYVRQRVRGDIASGNMDQTLKVRYGIAPQPNRRS